MIDISKDEKITLARLANILQDLAYQGYAEFEVDLDLESHELCGVQVDQDNKCVLLNSREKELVEISNSNPSVLSALKSKLITK